MQRALRCHVRCHDTIDRDDRLLSVIGHFLLPTVRLPFRLPLPLPSPLPVFPSLPAFPVPLLPAPFLQPLPVPRPLSPTSFLRLRFPIAPFPFVSRFAPSAPSDLQRSHTLPSPATAPVARPTPKKRERRQRKEHTEKDPHFGQRAPALCFGLSRLALKFQLFSFAESGAWTRSKIGDSSRRACWTVVAGKKKARVLILN